MSVIEEAKMGGRRYLTLGEIHEAMLETLGSFHDMCMERSIRYSLACGTLLGAVRHKGFIPWDDDVDVYVPRPDYERLISNSQWVPEGFALNSCFGPGGGVAMPFSKFCNLSYRAQEPAWDGVFEEHLWVDVFPVDAVPDDDAERHRLMSRQCRTLARAMRRVVNIDNVTANKAKLVVKKVTFPLLRAVSPAGELYARASRDAARLEYGSTGRVGNLSWISAPRDNWIPTADFDALTDIAFEGRAFKAIPSWDRYLTGVYGDYMKLPPVSRRQSHAVKAWRLGALPNGGGDTSGAGG